LAYDLAELGLDAKVQASIPLEYKRLVIETAFRADILVNDLVLIELKSVEELDSVYFKRTLTYLRLTGLKLALLINFNVELLKNGIHRIANNL
jgi:GxxExxY protein